MYCGKNCSSNIWDFYWLTSVSKSDEESVEEVGEPVIKVLNETDPEKSLFLPKPTLTLIGCKPRGQPSSYNHINQKKSRKMMYRFSSIISRSITKQNNNNVIRNASPTNQRNYRKKPGDPHHTKPRKKNKIWEKTQKVKSKRMRQKTKKKPAEPCLASTWGRAEFDGFLADKTQWGHFRYQINKWIRETVKYFPCCDFCLWSKEKLQFDRSWMIQFFIFLTR